MSYNIQLTKEGEEQYNIVFPKYKKGGYIVRKVVEKPTYGELNPCTLTVPITNLVPRLATKINVILYLLTSSCSVIITFSHIILAIRIHSRTTQHDL